MIALKEKLHRFLTAHSSYELRHFLKKLLFRGSKFNYDAAVQWAIQDEVCNLRCEYCRFSHAVKVVPPADVKSLLNALDKTGLTCDVSICGNGEPFLVPNIIEVLQELTKKHYVSIVSNLTLPKVREFCEKIDPRRVIFITASLHIKELERTGLTERFIENYLLCKKKGFDIRAQEVAHPSLLGEVEKYKKFFAERGVRLYFDDCFTRYEGKTYPDAYTDEERRIFGLSKKQDVMGKVFQKGKLCNAGYNICTVAKDGTVYPCPDLKEKIGDLREGNIGFRKQLIRCPSETCICPLNLLYYELFAKALEETHSKA